MEDFITLLVRHRSAAESLVRFKLPHKADADDLLQEVYLAAWRNFPQLKNKAAFKPWLLAIARRKCSDYFRKKTAQLELSLEGLPDKALADGRLGKAEVDGEQAEAVRETLALLGGKDRQILRLYFWEGLPQAEIAAQLQIPIGTVKSRLYAAKQHFKAQYPYPFARPKLSKGEVTMKKLPKLLPEYRIEALDGPAFPVKWEELSWFVVPRLEEALSWGMYDMPSRECSHIYDMKVTGKARIHGIEGVELTARESPFSDKKEVIERTFIAELTDTHCRFLAAFRNDNGVRSYLTFLDGDAFMNIWGFCEDNCGTETSLFAKGLIRREGDTLTVAANHPYLQDLVGRYRITIGERSFDTVCRIEINAPQEGLLNGVLAEHFIDKNGKTILWRRYNRSDWAIDHYKTPWEQQLPDNQRLIVNGNTYIHWYDCVTDYIF